MEPPTTTHQMNTKIIAIKRHQTAPIYCQPASPKPPNGPKIAKPNKPPKTTKTTPQPNPKKNLSNQKTRKTNKTKRNTQMTEKKMTKNVQFEWAAQRWMKNETQKDTNHKKGPENDQINSKLIE